MRIALITLAAPWSGAPLTGPYNNTQARALCALSTADRPVLCEIFTPTFGGPRILERLVPKLKRFNDRPAHDEYLGIKTHAVKALFPWAPTVRWKLSPRAPVFAAWTISRAVERRLLRELRAFKPDGLLIHDGVLNGAMGARLARALDIPFVVIEHDPIDFPADSRMGRYYRRVLSDARAIFSVGLPWYLHIRDALGMKQARLIVNGTVVPELDDISAPRPDRWKGKRLVLCVGAFIERKGHLILLEGFARAKVPDSQLVIVGQPPEHLLAKVREFDMQDRVEFVPAMSHDQVLQHMAWADLFALPSWWESFGLVYAEALAAGTPVIMTTDSGMSHHITHGVHGWIIPPKDVQALATTLHDALLRPDLKRMGQAGRELVERKLTWKRNAEIVLAGFAGSPDPDAHVPPSAQPLVQQSFSA